MIDFKNLEKMIAERYISVQKHPNLDLFIYNYTQKAQFDRVWNNETLQCRGLIMDGKHNIIARPFPKFFNLSEAVEKGDQLPAEDFIVTEKMDGSLGILYMGENGIPCLATRGSFMSDQAFKGTDILHEKYQRAYWVDGWTYLFEIIYPANRIVVDYGKREDIVLLTAIKTATGEELAYDKLKEFAEIWGIPVVQKYDAIRDFSKIEARDNAEGYVITYTNGQRYKIKHDEYVRLHRLVTQVNSKVIWELLKNNQNMDELLERVPDEFFAWVKKTKENLEYEYNVIEGLAIKHWEVIKTLPDRKTQALALMKTEEKQKIVIPIVFALLDKKPYDHIIWKQIRPRAERPFTEEI